MAKRKKIDAEQLEKVIREAKEAKTMITKEVLKQLAKAQARVTFNGRNKKLQGKSVTVTGVAEGESIPHGYAAVIAYDKGGKKVRQLCSPANIQRRGGRTKVA